MKFFKNIKGGWKIVKSVKKNDKRKYDLEKFRKEGKIDEEREYLGYYTKLWVNELIEDLDITVDARGQENIPDGPCVFISNHQSYADVFALMSALDGKQAGFIAKQDLKKVPYFGKWIERIRGILIPTGNPREALKVINQGVDYINQGFSMVIFPEGKRSWSSEMDEFKPGSFKLATKSKVPIVPVTLEGGYHAFEEKGGEYTPGTKITVVFDKPIETKNLDRKQLKAVPEETETIIKNNLKKILMEKEKLNHNEE